MLILVTGAPGFIGGVVTKVLIERGHPVVAVNNLSIGHREAVHPGARLVLGDGGDRRVLNEVSSQFSVDADMHLAAEALVAESVTDPRRFCRANVEAGLILLGAILDHGVGRVVCSSTGAVFGQSETIPITEGMTKQPINSYGESKPMFERILRWYRVAYGLRFVTL